MEDSDDYYVGTILFTQKRIARGYSYAEAEAQLKKLAILFGKAYKQGSFIFIDREGSACLHRLQNAESAGEEAEENLNSYYDGDEERLQKIVFHPEGEAVYTEINGMPFVCRLRCADNDINRAGDSRSNFHGLSGFRRDHIEKYNKDPLHYFVRRSY
ncbi:hypothetical protein IJT93_07905 [bacterium]|nr:hypothetical protein [bacterium]